MAKKHILDLDNLFTKSQDENNKHILGHDDLFPKSQEEDNKNFLEFDYLQRNSLPFFFIRKENCLDPKAPLIFGG